MHLHWSLLFLLLDVDDPHIQVWEGFLNNANTCKWGAEKDRDKTIQECVWSGPGPEIIDPGTLGSLRKILE